MNWALRELGLEADADERAIKRAYAKRLKTTRPEDDPEGFQRLHDAYRAALSWMPSPEVDADIDLRIDTATDGFAEDAQSGAVSRTLSQEALFELLDAHPPGAPQPAAPEDRGAALDLVADVSGNVSAATHIDATRYDEGPQFDPDAFLDDCVALAVRGREGELLEWLNAQPALWSLAHKTRIAPRLLQHLHERRPPIEARRFDTVAEFFGLLDLHSGYDAYSIQRLRHHLQLAWEIETRQIGALAERSGQDGGSVASNLRQTGRILKQLTRPLHWPQALWTALVPGYPSAVRNFLLRLDFGNLDDLPTQIREDQIEFWEAAGDRSRFSKARWAVWVARLCTYTLATALLFALCSAMTPVGTSIAEVIEASFTPMLILCVAYLVYGTFIRWQALPESTPARVTWLRAAVIPLMGAMAVAIDDGLGFEDLGIVLASIMFLLAMQRYRLRTGFGWKLRLRHQQALLSLLGLFTLCIVFASGFISLGIVCMALAVWAMDMRKQRAALRN